MRARRAMAIMLLGWGGAQVAVAQAPANSAPSAAFVYIAPVLGITPHRTLADALAAPFPDTYDVTIRKSSPPLHKTIRNCSDFLPVKDEKITTGSSLDDATLQSLGVTCVALDWIRTAAPAAHPAFSDFTFRRLTVRALPPELALSISREERSAVKTASEKGGSILDVEPGLRLRAKAPGSAELVSPDWTANLTVYAHGDFAGDSGEDLLVRWEAKATGGTYKSTSLFLLAHHGDGLVVVRQYPGAS